MKVKSIRRHEIIRTGILRKRMRFEGLKGWVFRYGHLLDPEISFEARWIGSQMLESEKLEC